VTLGGLPAAGISFGNVSSLVLALTLTYPATIVARNG
jgi:hypothetical protein